MKQIVDRQNNKDYLKKGAVTLLDVLGWKGVWQRKPTAVKELKAIIEQATNRALELVGEDKFKNLKEFKNLKVEVKSISDTIALITYGDCAKTLRFQGILSSFLIAIALEKGFFLRGATCYGELYNEDNIFVGPAIDEVASWYESVNWIGVILTPSALWSLEEELNTSDINLYHEESVVVKQHGSFKTYCANWPNAYKWRNTENSDKNLKSAFIENGPVTPDIALKLSNTLQFYEKYKDEFILESMKKKFEKELVQ